GGGDARQRGGGRGRLRAQPARGGRGLGDVPRPEPSPGRLRGERGCGAPAAGPVLAGSAAVRRRRQRGRLERAARGDPLTRLQGTWNPAWRSSRAVAISGRPTSAVGSWLWIASNRAIPRA